MRFGDHTGTFLNILDPRDFFFENLLVHGQIDEFLKTSILILELLGTSSMGIPQIRQHESGVQTVLPNPLLGIFAKITLGVCKLDPKRRVISNCSLFVQSRWLHFAVKTCGLSTHDSPQILSTRSCGPGSQSGRREKNARY